MPVTITRSLLVVIIPGLIALVPWLLWVATHVHNFDVLYAKYEILINVSLVGIAIIIGSVAEGAVSHLEAKWDRERETTYNVRNNWFDYLSQKFSTEPVGFRYISRMFTTLYFELAMMVASPFAFVGGAVLLFDKFHSGACWGWALLVAALGLSAFFYWQAKCTHEVLCQARQEINRRLKEQTDNQRFNPYAS